VATVLGLVGRDLLLDTIQAVIDEDAPAAFALAARAVDMGYDLRAVCRELSRVVRDLLVLSVDPSRASDPEIAGEGERARLVALAAAFSREDLLRAFDLLTRAEAEVKVAAQPRYQLEMALLRWIYLRKLVSIDDLIAGAGAGSGSSRTVPEKPAPSRNPIAAPVRAEHAPPPRSAPVTAPTASVAAELARPSAPPVSTTFKDALFAAIRQSKAAFYNMVVAQAQKIEIAGDRVTFTFSPAQRALRDAFEQNRPWLETLAQQVAGRKIAVAAVQSVPADTTGDAPADVGDGAADQKSVDRKSALRKQALADAGVQAMLEVFAAEIRDVEEM
jgi:DNA polymerase-3 subunit gamma/tau